MKLIKVTELKEGDVFRMQDGAKPFSCEKDMGVTRTVRLIESFPQEQTNITTTYCGYSYTFDNDVDVVLIKPNEAKVWFNVFHIYSDDSYDVEVPEDEYPDEWEGFETVDAALEFMKQLRKDLPNVEFALVKETRTVLVEGHGVDD